MTLSSRQIEPSRTGRERGAAPALPGGLESLAVAVGSLRCYPGNPRRGDVEAIKQSLMVNGQYRAVVVNRRTMQVLAGNHTLLAARELGWKRIAATFVDVDEQQAKRILLVDNRASDLAGYDESELVELLSALPELDGTGWDQAALDRLLDTVGAEPLGEDELPPLPASPRTRTGDVWLLGAHRLVCGDAREPSVYERLLGGERPELVWTDPPYGVGYQGKTAERLRIKGDQPAGLRGLLDGAFAALDGAVLAGGRVYVCHPAGPLSAVFLDAFLGVGWRLAQTLVWLKDQFVLGRGDYHYRHEPILYGYKPAPGQGRSGRGGRGWYGGHDQGSVFEIPRPKCSPEHPTAKPPALVQIALRNSSRRGGLVLDPFAGSGSTLVACEQTARRARLIEVDPGYCDVIVDRFERLTGVRAVREGA